jgi:hypothetical protein
MAGYHRKWRHYDAQARALAQSSDSDSAEGIDHQSMKSSSSCSDTPEVCDNPSEDSLDDEESEESRYQASSYSSELSTNSSDSDSSENPLDCRDWSTSNSEAEVCDNGEVNSPLRFDQKLAKLAVRHKLSKQCTRDLLGLLRAEGHHLPKDPRTLLKTPRHVYINEKCGGQYTYFGIENSLMFCLKQNPWFAEQNDNKSPL